MSHWKLRICPMVELVVPIVGSVQLRGTLAEVTLLLESEMGAGGGALEPSAPTVILTAAEVPVRPLLSVATAVMEWLPAPRPE